MTPMAVDTPRAWQYPTFHVYGNFHVQRDTRAAHRATAKLARRARDDALLGAVKKERNLSEQLPNMHIDKANIKYSVSVTGVLQKCNNNKLYWRRT